MVHKISNFLLLPSELKHHIAELSSRGTLASLALIHTAYQVQAEQALYHTISFVADDHALFDCMRTLATNSEKAAYVRALSLHCHQFTGYNAGFCECSNRIMTGLLDGLLNMHSLRDFQLSMLCGAPQAKMIELGQILCGDHFRLKTLYCCLEFPNLNTVSQIIKTQTELHILGIYDPINGLARALKQLRDVQFSLPIIVELEKWTSDDWRSVGSISIFPTFYDVNRIAMIHQALVESLLKDKLYRDIEHLDGVSIYLTDSSEIATICALAKDMSLIFPDITYLSFRLEHQYEIPAKEVKEIITFFPMLTNLCIDNWSWRDGNRVAKIPQDIKVAYVKEWLDVCPELDSVVMDYSTYYADRERD